MSLPSRLLSVLLLVLAAVAGADEPRFDAAGDPLPDGALARLGTVRFRFRGYALALSPDGKTLAAGGLPAVRLFEVASGKMIRELADGKSGRYSVLSFTPDGRLLAGTDDRGIQLWDVATGRAVGEVGAGHRFLRSDLSFSADGRLVVAGAEPSGKEILTLRVWEVATGKEVAAVRPLPDLNLGRALSGDGKVLATWGLVHGRDTGTVQLWDATTGKERKRLQLGADNPIDSIALSANGRRMVVCASGRLTMWDTQTAREVGRFEARRSGYHCFFSSDGKVLVGVGYPLVVELWEVMSGRRLGLHEPGLQAYLGPAVVLTADGRLLAATSTDAAAAVWDVRTGKRLSPGVGHETGVLGVGFAGGGKELSSASGDGTLCRWDVATGREKGRSQLIDDRTRSGLRRWSQAVVSPDGRHLLGCDSYRAVLRRTADGREVGQFTSGGFSRVKPAFSADGSRVLIVTRAPGGRVGPMRVYDVTSGREVAELTGSPEGVTEMALSSFGKTAAAFLSRGDDHEVRAWDVSTGKERWSGVLNVRGLARLAFSPDDVTLAVADHRPEITLLHAATGEVQRRWRADGTSGLAFAPDGRSLVSITPVYTGREVVVRVWELATGTLRQRLLGHEGMLGGLAISPDGTVLATGSHDTTVLFWDLTGRVGRPKPKAQPGERELDALWADLDAADAKTAHEAMAKLHLAPAEVVALFTKRLSAVKKVDVETIAALVAELDHDRFARRDRARRELEALGPAATAALRQALEGKPSVEMKKQVEELLRKLEPAAPKPEWVRAIRAVELLERLGTAEAKALLESYAAGVVGARLTEEAKASLRRLNALKTSP